MDRKRRESLILAAYVALTSFCLLPAFDVAFNSAGLWLGVPISVLWLTGCFVALVALAIFGYYSSFRFWTAPVEDQAALLQAEGAEDGSGRH